MAISATPSQMFINVDFDYYWEREPEVLSVYYNQRHEFKRRIEYLFLCKTCGRTISQEGSQFCSNPYHLVIPVGYKMVQGRLEKI